MEKNGTLYAVDPITDLRMMLENSAQKFGGRAAFLQKTGNVAGYQPISYTQFRRDVVALEAALRSFAGRKQYIALIGDNCYEWAVAYMATVSDVGVVVPLDKELPEQELYQSLVRSGATVVIFSSHLRDKVLACTARIPAICKLIMMGDGPGDPRIQIFRDLLDTGYRLTEGGRCWERHPIDVDTMSVMLFTSGTTQRGKAVMLSQRNLCENLMAMASMVYVDEEDVFLSVLPLHHAYECTCGFLCPIYRGASIAYCEGLHCITKNLEESQATVLLGVPALFESLYQGMGSERGILGQGKSLRLMVSGAAGVRPEIGIRFNQLGIRFIQGYGLTECAPIVTLNRDCYYKDASVGLPLPGTEIQIQDPDDQGIGEILVRGPQVMLGYYGDETATSRVMTQEGFFRTGDLGSRDEDGFVYITGRKKNVIIKGNGKNIFPEELEELLEKSPYICEAVVYGQEAEGALALHATIFPDYSRIKEDVLKGILPTDHPRAIIRQEMKAVNRQLPEYKNIDGFQIREREFDKTSSNKIKRFPQHVDGEDRL